MPGAALRGRAYRGLIEVFPRQHGSIPAVAGWLEAFLATNLTFSRARYHFSYYFAPFCSISWALFLLAVSPRGVAILVGSRAGLWCLCAVGAGWFGTQLSPFSYSTSDFASRWRHQPHSWDWSGLFPVFGGGAGKRRIKLAPVGQLQRLAWSVRVCPVSDSGDPQALLGAVVFENLGQHTLFGLGAGFHPGGGYAFRCLVRPAADGVGGD